ncbi:MAG TPA: GNAT family N-acetyltransferase [Ktedonobacterales bacterium]|nr:GNAT family N-acetyltransferase [Ktedonobacterales bacterium]
MTSIAFSAASTLSLEQVTHAFNLAFTGYYLPMTQTTHGLSQMMRENDVRLDDSAVIFVNGDLAGVGLVGVRGARGWIAGMGVAPAWRGQGIGARLLERLLSHMRAIGLREAQLEALDINTPALTLYERMGFRDVRSLLVYHGPLRLDTAHAHADGDHTRMRAVTARHALAHFAIYHAVAPAWQRERASLERVRGPLEGQGLWEDGRLRAYVLFSRQSGGCALLDAGSSAPEPEARRGDIERLLRAAANPAPATIFRAINTPPGDALGDALDLLGCPVTVTQREMTLDLLKASSVISHP